MDNKSENDSPYILLFIGVLAVSTAAILIKLSLAVASPIAIAFYRMAFSAVIAIIILLVKPKQKKEKLDKSTIWLLILSGILLAAHFALWTWSLDLVSVNSSVIFATTSPLWVGLLSPILLKERVPKRFYLGILFAFAGGLLIALLGGGNGGENNWQGLLMSLLSAWMIAGYLLIGRKISSKMSTELYVSVVYSVAALALGIALLFLEGGFQAYPRKIYQYLFMLALVPQTIGHTAMNKALRKLPARTVSLALLFEPVGSSILAMAFLNEMPSAVEIAGGILILIGLVIALSANPNEA